MRISIKRCPLMRLAGHEDLTWEVTDWQQSVVHPTYDLMGGCECWLMQGCALFTCNMLQASSPAGRL